MALLLLAVGLLGLAALQGRGVRFNHEAYSRSQAIYLAHDLIDSIRANAASAGQYATTAPAATCNPAASSPANDLRCWLDAVAALLPAGGGAVEQDGPRFHVTLRWQERGARQATSRAECESVPSRAWDGSLCLVAQSWTFMP